MNNRCWRNSRPRINGNVEITWPKLPHPALQERQNIRSILRPQISRNNCDLAGTSQSDEPQKNLDAVEYPKLGEIVLKRKNNIVDSSQGNYQDSEHSIVRRLRRHRSTDLVHINLQRTLERQRWPLLFQSEHPTRITVDICKLNVNMSVPSPLDGRQLLPQPKRSPMFIVKKKKTSKLKWRILYKREVRKQLVANRQGITGPGSESPTHGPEGDIPPINLDRLNISIVSHDDSELVKKMSVLSCLGTNYRNTSEINITEDTVTFHPDLHEKMEILSLDKTDDSGLDVTDRGDGQDVCKIEPIECEMIDAMLNLKVCDETGEFTENIVIKEEPGRIKFSKKFREYCTNTVTPNLKKYLEELLAEMSRLQKKMYERDIVKGKSKRRYYAGIKEVQKHIDLKKIKFVVIATDLEKVESEGGLDDVLNKLIGTCKRYEVPYCFGLNRRKLGFYIHGKGFVSCIGIANYSGAEEKIKNVLLEVVEARNEFARSVCNEAKTIDVHKLLPQEELILSEIINAYLKILATNT